MRSISRAAALFALAVVAITCTDAPTSPAESRGGWSAARLTMAPSFTPAAARAYASLAEMGISVTHARIRLRTGNGTVSRDTTIAFGADDTLRVRIPIEIQGTEQTFSALVELRDAAGIVLFAQTQDVIARAAHLPAAPAPVIALEYVGPGAAARAIAVSPGDLTVPGNTDAMLTAVATDSAGTLITDLLVGWTSSDTAVATVRAVGPIATVRGTGRRGAVVITATSPNGLVGTARLSMLPVAVRLVVILGDAQSGIAGRLLAQPLIVELQGADGGPIPGAAVSFRAVTPGGVATPATAITDAVGRVSVSLTLGRVAGAYSFEAVSLPLSSATVVATVVATATPAPATRLDIVGDVAPVDSVGALLPLVVRAVDEFGASVSGTSITWQRVAGLGTLEPAVSLSGPDGLGRTSYLLGAVPSIDTVRATLTGSTGAAATVVFAPTSIVRGASTIVITSGGAQSGVAGTMLPLPLVARVTDVFGNGVSGATVRWQMASAGVATFATPVSITDAAGEARTAVTLGIVAGSSTVIATTGSTSATASIGVVAGAAAQFGVLQPAPSSIVVGVAPSAPILARLDDAFGNPVKQAGMLVTATLTLPPGTSPLLVASALTDSAGIATLVLPAYVGTAGTAVLTLTADGVSPSASNPILVVPGAPASLVAVSPPASPVPVIVSGLPLAVVPTVQVVDAGANAVPAGNIAVTAGVAGGGATITAAPAVTDATGRAAFAGLIVTGLPGSVTLTFSAPSLAPASLRVDLIADTTLVAVPTLSITPVNGTEFSAISPAASLPQQIEARVLDSLGRAVPGAQLMLQLAFTGGCSFPGGGSTLIVDTDLTGLARYNLDLAPLAAGGGGCTVWARGGSGGKAQSTAPQLSYRIAVTPTPQHAVWWGDSTLTGGDWTVPANWRSTTYPIGLTQKVFVPMWESSIGTLTLDRDLEIGEIALDRNATTRVTSAATMRVAGAVRGAAGSAISGAGRLVSTGSSTLISIPSLSNLVVGDSTSCVTAGTMSATVTGTLLVDSLTSYCRTVIDGQTTVNRSLRSAGGGRVELTSAAASLVSKGDASFSGDSLIVSAGSLVVGGAATFGGSGALSGGSVRVVGDATFGGVGRGGYALTGGTLELEGGFAQKRSDTASTFVATGTHRTTFLGSALQRVMFDDANASSFAAVSFANGGGGVLIPLGSSASATVSADVTSTALLMVDGTLAGGVPVLLGGGSKLIVNGRLASGCTGALAVPPPLVSGTGLIGLALLPALLSSCTP